MTTRRKLIAGVGALAAAASMPSYRAFAQSSAPVRIGMLLPLTGPAAVYGNDMKTGAEIALEHVNGAGGIAGRNLELIIRDTKARPDEAVALTRALAADGVNLIVGGLFTTEAAAMLPILASANSVMISTGAIAMSLTHESYTPHFFRGTDNNYMRMSALAQLASRVNPEIRTWSAIMTDVESSRDAWRLFQTFARRAFPNPDSLTFVPPVLTRIGGGDFRNQVAAAMASPATGFFMNVPGSDGVTFFQQARPFGFGDKVKCILDFGQEFAVAKALGANIIDHWTPSHWYFGLYQDLPMVQRLVRDYTARTGDDLPSGYVHVTYSGIQCFTQAINAIGGRTDTRSVIEALENGRFDTGRGPLRFRKEDHQGLGDVNFMRLSPDASRRHGFVVSNAVKLPAIDVVEPPTPGRPVEL